MLIDSTAHEFSLGNSCDPRQLVVIRNSVPFALVQHLNRLTSYGVGYKTYTEQFFDSCGIFKDAVIAIMATLAKQERIKRSERTKAGLERVRAAGKALGRPKRLNGQHTAQIARLRSQGLSLRAIARQLGISDHSARRLAAA